MNSVKILGAVAAILVTSGCNSGQPRIWRVAYDTSGFVFVEQPQCYISKRLPQAGTAQTNYRRDANWVVWDGVTDASGRPKQYLDIGNPSFKLGDAPRVVVEDAIEGDAAERDFRASRETRNFGPAACNATNLASCGQTVRNAIETRTGEVTVTWESYNPASTGLIKVKSTYRCADNNTGMLQDLCPNVARPGETPANDAAECEVQVPFVARRIDVQQNTNYSNSGCDGPACGL
jgi:hypothetical protein